MKDEDRQAFYDYGERLEGGIRTAVEAWCEDQVAAKLQYGPIASWNTSEITNMEYLFYDFKAGFNEDISRWDVSNVTSLHYTFWCATSFNGDLSRWDVSNVTSLIRTFNGATSFNGDLSRWDVSKVTSMIFMFSGATSFDQQLGDAWARSTAPKICMFNRSPGSIVGQDDKSQDGGNGRNAAVFGAGIPGYGS